MGRIRSIYSRVLDHYSITTLPDDAQDATIAGLHRYANATNQNPKIGRAHV
jgi:hypothetical protein